ncbi:MAG TPA: hypothetical protein VGX25_32470 [Actinophytocola sp.]|uniref:hypothetical protein n=1 Tax=Actinophytocola sp. TaxID=1872138 RepID=UPI002DDD57A7|nr:hypothetical protein [Actinophytocola sp.]HEV2784126.1 hypothetical protein [Actinophytocola sp.]
MGFVRDLLVFFHLLGMATLVAAFFLQLRIGLDGPLTKGWLHGAGLQLITGVALQLLAPLTDADYDNAKLGIKLLVLIVLGVLAIFYTVRGPAKRWVPITLIALTVVNVGLAVFWN